MTEAAADAERPAGRAAGVGRLTTTRRRRCAMVGASTAVSIGCAGAPYSSMSIAEWVRQALDLARRREPITDVGKKLEIIRAAVQYDYPSGDIEDMLAEIESGYGSGAHT